MARASKKRRVKLATLLVVGEGLAEKAFIEHMKGLYSQNTGQKVTVKGEGGGSPSVMIFNVLKNYQHAKYDRVILMLDEDVPITAQDEAKARRNNITLIVSSPVCLEGMLLSILEQVIPFGASSSACKDLLHPQLSGSATRKESYSNLFPKPLLDRTEKAQIVSLRELLSNRKKR